MKFIGLLREDKKVEYNARFVLGNKIAESLEYGKLYSNEDFEKMGAFPMYAQTCSQNPILKDEKMRWRCVDINNGM